MNITSLPILSTTQRKTIGVLLTLVALLLLPHLIAYGAGNTWVRTLDFALLYIMLALGLNIVVGYAGLLDLGYIAFYGLGAYVYALLSSPHLAYAFPQFFHDTLAWSPWIILPLGGLIAGIFGLILGAPTLKLRGDYLAIVTLGFGEIINICLKNLYRPPLNLTNGPQGISPISSIT
jgi:branched-chain amino acid transport system permease protein